MALQVGELFAVLGADNEPFNQALETAERDFNAIGDSMQKAGGAMALGLTAPITAFGALMVKGAAEAQVAQGKLQASLGITSDEAADLQSVANEVWASGFGENIEEVNEALTTVRHNMGKLADDEMQKVTEGAMTIANVFGEDVNAVTAAAGVAMKNFGTESQETLDLITYGFQKGGNFSGELLDTLREYSPQFVSLGLSADQAMGMLIAGAEAGAWNLDKVGDSMKEFNLRATDESKSTAEAFAAIGLEAGKMEMAIASGGEGAQSAFAATITALASMKNPLEQNAAGVALFGTQWEDVRSKVIVAMESGMDGIDDFKGSTEEATKAMQENNPALAMTQAMREFQLAVGPVLLGFASVIRDQIVPAIRALTGWFSNLSPVGQKLALAFVGLVAAAGPLLVAVGTLIKFLPAMKVAFVAMTGPIGLTIAAIAALAAIVYLVIKNWEPIKKFFSNLWESMKTTVFGWGKSISAWVKTTIPKIISSVSTFFAELPFNIGYALGVALKTLGQWGVDAANWVASEVPKIISSIGSFFTQLPGNIYESLSDVISNMIEWLGNMGEKVATETPKITTKLMSFFEELPGKMLSVGKNIVEGLWEGIKGAKDWLWGMLKGFAQGIIDGLKSGLGISSPSKLTMEMGAYISEGMALGIESGLSDVKSALSSIYNAASISVEAAGQKSTSIAVNTEDKSPFFKVLELIGASNQNVIEALMMVVQAVKSQNMSLDIDGQRLTKIVRELLQSEDGRVGPSKVTIGGVPV